MGSLMDLCVDFVRVRMQQRGVQDVKVNGIAIENAKLKTGKIIKLSAKQFMKS